MAAYYNDNDPRICAWLRELIADGLIAPGDVDERDIREVTGDDLKDYSQVHLFAGIGGFSAALRLAGFPDDRPIWTGSCPCPSFSAAGKGQGFADPRGQIWVEMFRLIRKCRPGLVFGEQVDGAIRYGWLDRVFDDLETLSYDCGAAVLPACSAGAPHIRSRLFWVAEAERGATGAGIETEQGPARGGRRGSAICRGAVRLPDASGAGLAGLPEQSARQERQAVKRGFWSRWRIAQFRDGRQRRVPLEPALWPLVARLPGRVVGISGAGNSIVPQVAAEFIRAALKGIECTNGQRKIQHGLRGAG